MIVTTGLRSTLALIAVALMVGSPQAVAGSINPPNVIIILADDLGYGDLGVQGGRDVATPRIDQLAREGVRLTDYYANNPVCAPSRAALMSGQYQQRFGFENNPGMAERTSPDFKLSALPTLPERLRKSGYATAMFGKWHLGFTPGNTPIDRGFDTFYGFLDGAMAYTPEGRTGSKAMLRGTVPTAMPAHTTEAFASEAVQFIEANTARPFFVYASFNAVHAPMQSTDRYLARFKSEPDPKRRAHLAMLAALDDAVGAIIDAVDRNGLGKNTLIVFTSDNGGPTWQTTSSNTPLNGVKALVLEGGIRVPAIFRWTGTLPKARVLDTVAMEFDLTATTLALAGSPLTPDLDGVSLIGYLKGDQKGDAHKALYWRSGPQGAMRQGLWKLVKAEDAWYLFNLKSDIGEHHDLAATDPQRLNAMKAAWQAWSATMPPARWGGPRSGTDKPGNGKLQALMDNYIRNRPVAPQDLLYGGGPE